MSELLGIDFAWSKPTPQQVITLGARWVAGYLSPDPTKNLTRPLVDTYQSLGLSVVVVWESTGGRATQGRAAGIADASSAYAQHAGLGLPVGPIYFAVDEDVAWDQVGSPTCGRPWHGRVAPGPPTPPSGSPGAQSSRALPTRTRPRQPTSASTHDPRRTTCP